MLKRIGWIGVIGAVTAAVAVGLIAPRLTSALPNVSAVSFNGSDLPNMVERMDGTLPLWWGKSGPAPYSPQSIGFESGAITGWVAQAAVNQYGPNVSIPLPASFVATHRGALEVWSRVLYFNNVQAPITLLHNQTFYNWGYLVESGAVTPLSNPIAGGNVYEETVGSETAYVYIWARGPYFLQVFVEGNGISQEQAQSIAEILDAKAIANQ